MAVKKPTEKTIQAIKKLSEHYAKKDSWEIWLDSTTKNTVKHTVTCTDSITLTYLTNIFYGLRNIFVHGSPQKTIGLSGIMRKDRIPRTPSDIGIEVQGEQGTSIEAVEACQSALYEYIPQSEDQATEVQMRHNRFLTACSFYAYMVQIVGSVGACVVYRCSDRRIREKATEALQLKLEEIQEAVDEAWSTGDRTTLIRSPAAHDSERASTSYSDLAINKEPKRKKLRIVRNSSKGGEQPEELSSPSASSAMETSPESASQTETRGTGLTPDFEDFDI